MKMYFPWAPPTATKWDLKKCSLLYWSTAHQYNKEGLVEHDFKHKMSCDTFFESYVT